MGTFCKSVSYPKEDLQGPAGQSFFGNHSDKDLKARTSCDTAQMPSKESELVNLHYLPCLGLPHETDSYLKLMFCSILCNTSK